MSLFSKDKKEGDVSIDKAKGTIAGVFNSISGVNRTINGSPIGLIDRNGKRQSPGFTPNSNYVTDILTSDNDTWYGALLESHPDYTGKSGWYQYNKKTGTKQDLSTSERFDKSKVYPNFKDDVKDPYQHYSTRDYYLLFNDSSTDYFKHGLHVIDNKTPLRSDKNAREAWDGHEEGTPLRLDNVLRDNTGMGGTPYENTDPILFGFEVIIDAVSSPLLNGAVEDFIAQFSKISEVGARKYVLADFKQQFIKLFKTKGNVFIDQESNGQIKTSITTSNFANSDSQTNVFEPGKKAYMSYYLKKIQGLEMLLESNQPAKKKYLTDYRNDVIKLTFNEDVSSNMGTLSHLYKLLYWSKSSGKNIIPENLLRFNCDIVISEVRNLNRVRKAMDTGNLEVIKDNVSRFIYSLKECQFYFDQPAHDSEIDMSQGTKEFDQFVVTMDYKYVTSKFERWVPDAQGFGTYVGYNNGALWKIGNPGSRTNQTGVNAGTLEDNSVPKFFTAGLNTFKYNGVKAPIVLESYTYTTNDPIDNITNSNKNPKPTGSGNTGDETEGSNETSKDSKGARTSKAKNAFETFKQNSKKASQKLAKNLEKAVKNELTSQVNVRLRLLNNTLDKIRNASGLGRMREPTNIYKVPYFYEGISNGLGGQVSSRFFYDVHNSLRDFAGESVGGKLGGMLKGGSNDVGLFGK